MTPLTTFLPSSSWISHPFCRQHPLVALVALVAPHSRLLVRHPPISYLYSMIANAYRFFARSPLVRYCSLTHPTHRFRVGRHWLGPHCFRRPFVDSRGLCRRLLPVQAELRRMPCGVFQGYKDTVDTIVLLQTELIPF